MLILRGEKWPPRLACSSKRNAGGRVRTFADEYGQIATIATIGIGLRVIADMVPDS